MGDNDRTEFDGNDSDEDIERPPTPQFHDGSGDGESSPAGEETGDGTNDGANDGSEKRGKGLSNSTVAPVSDTTAKEDEDDPVLNVNSSTSLEQEPSASSSKTVEDLEEAKDSELIHDKEDVVAAADKSAEVGGDDDDMELDDKDGEQEPEESARPDGSSNDNADESAPTEDKADSARPRRVSAASGGTGTEDEDLEMAMSPIGDLGLTGIETEIADDILKSDVNEFLPEGKEEGGQSVETYGKCFGGVRIMQYSSVYVTPDVHF